MVEKFQNRYVRLTCAYLTACIFAVIAGVILFSENVHTAIFETFGRVNLIIYVIICAVLLIGFYLTWRFLFQKDTIGGSVCRSAKASWIAALIPLTVNGLLMLVQFANEPRSYIYYVGNDAETYLWHTMPLPAFVLIEAALCGVVLLLWRGGRTREDADNSDRMEKVAYWTLAALLCGLVGYSAYCTNPFWNLYHVSAYYNPVLYMWNRVPLNEITNSIYGHYGFFYIPVMKLLQLAGAGSVMRCFEIAIAGVALLTELCFAFILYRLVKNRFLQITGLIATGLSMLCLRRITYYQLFPHRIFPIAIFAAFMVVVAKSKKRGLMAILGYLLGALCVLWNTEAGIFVLIGWTAYWICTELQTMQKGWWLRSIAYLLGIAAAFCIAWGIVDLYNLSVGGRLLKLNEFAFPLMCRYYMTTRLEAPLYGILTTWVVITGVLMFFVCNGLASTRLCGKEKNAQPVTAVLFAFAVMELGCYTYAINRSVYGHYTIGYEMIVILLCVLAERLLPYSKDLFQLKGERRLTKTEAALGGFGLSVSCIVVSLAFWCVSTMFVQMEYRQKTSNPEVVTWLYQDTEGLIADDTLAFGFGAVETMALYDRDPGVYTMNYMDIEIDGPAPKLDADRLLGEATDVPVLIAEEVLNFHKEWQLGGYDAFMQSHTLKYVWGAEYGEPAFPLKLLYFEPKS